LFRQGKDLLGKGKVAEACDAFDASQKLEPNTSTLLNQASCREKNQQYATAWGLYLDAERQTRSASDAAGKSMHATSADRAAKLEARLSTLTVTVPADAQVGGLEVLRNGAPVDSGAWNKALPVDGGTYEITARAPGNAEWKSTITVGPERDAKTLAIPKLTPAAIPVRPSPPPPPPLEQPSRDIVRHGHGPAIVATAGAVVLGGSALAFELWGSSTYDKAKKEPDDSKQSDLWHSANTKRYLAEGLGIAGVACAGVAVWLWVRSGEHASATSTALVPTVGSDHAGLVLEGGF
jgi:hypothetical protein